MKKLFIELGIIIGLSIVAAIGYNYLSDTPLPLFEKYDAHKVELTASSQQDNQPVIQLNEIDADSLQALVESESAVLFDARKPEEFITGYIPKAINFPIADFKEKYPLYRDLLADGKTIITYCVGIHCTDSTMLAKELFQKGHTDIFVFKGGVEEWQEYGYPLITGNGEEH